MYTNKIQELEKEINEIKNNIKRDKKEINKRSKILALANDERLESEIIVYLDEIENFKKLLQIKKQLLKNYKKL